MCSVRLAAVANGAPELLGQLRVEGRGTEPGRVGGEVEPVGEIRAARQVQRHLDQRLVERQQDGREAPDAGLVAQRLGQAPAEHDAHVLDGVVRIDLQVALRLDREVERGVLAQLFDHVVEEGQARRDLGAARAVEVERHGDGRLLGGAVAPGLAGGGCSGCGGHRLSFKRVQEAIVLLGGADRDAQAPLEALPAGAIADQDRVGEERAPDFVGVAVAGAEEDEVGIGGPAVDRQIAQRRRHTAAFLGDAGNPRLHLGHVAERQQPGRLGLGGEVVRQHDRFAGSDDGRVRDEIARGARRPAPTSSRRSA